MGETFKAFLIPPELSRMSHTGQVPAQDRRKARAVEKVFDKPRAPTVDDLERDTSPRLTAARVVDGLGFDRVREQSYTKFLDEQAASAPNELRYRQGIMAKMRDDNLDSGVRRVMFDRALSFYRSRQPLGKSLLTLDDLAQLRKGEPRGGMYFRRVPTEKGHRYYYDPETYHRREDAHISGADVLKKKETAMTKDKDQIPGGLADRKDPASFDPKVVKQGEKVEMEHTDDPAKAREIARDHIVEHGPEYYDKLKDMESKMSKADEEVMRYLDKAELSPEKARKILHDKEVKGHPLTDQQRKYMGAVASGTAQKSQSVCESILETLDREAEEAPAQAERLDVAEDTAEAGNGGLDPEEGIDMLKSFVDGLEKSGGEGSRGGHVIGHGAGGKPIYAKAAGEAESHYIDGNYKAAYVAHSKAASAAPDPETKAKHHAAAQRSLEQAVSDKSGGPGMSGHAKMRAKMEPKFRAEAGEHAPPPGTAPLGHNETRALHEATQTRYKKSCEGDMNLETWLQKAEGGTLPGGDPSCDSGVEVSSPKNGGKINGVGKQSGEIPAAKSPIGDVPAGESEKLSPDDAEVEKQLTDHETPMLNLLKSMDGYLDGSYSYQAPDQETARRRHAAWVAGLRKSRGNLELNEISTEPEAPAQTPEALEKSDARPQAFKIGRGDLRLGGILIHESADEQIAKSLEHVDDEYPLGVPSLDRFGGIRTK